MAAENLINSPRDWGHVKSPFFKLPPEIRNKIYREAFTGSEVALVIDPPLDVNVVPVTGRRSIFSTANSNHHFLLTCFQVYLEALALYWATTVVRNGCDGHFSRGYFLNRIPAFAKPYIQHLRDVNGAPSRRSKWLRGELIRCSSSLAEALHEFPNLKSCLIKEWRRGRSQNLSVSGRLQNLSLSGRSQNLSVSYECDQAVTRNPNVHIIEKDVTWETNPLGPHMGVSLPYPFGYPVMLRQVCSSELSSSPPVLPQMLGIYLICSRRLTLVQTLQYVFLNRTSGRKILWVQAHGFQQISDEECVEMLVDPVPNLTARRLMVA